MAFGFGPVEKVVAQVYGRELKRGERSNSLPKRLSAAQSHEPRADLLLLVATLEARSPEPEARLTRSMHRRDFLRHGAAALVTASSPARAFGIIVQDGNRPATPCGA